MEAGQQHMSESKDLFYSPRNRKGRNSLITYKTLEFSWTVSGIRIALTNPESWPDSNKGPNPPVPHMKALMHCDDLGDDQIYRGEFVAVIKTMIYQLRRRTFGPHLVAPVRCLI